VHRVLAELGVEDEVLLWNVVPTHPGSESSNRRPTREAPSVARRRGRVRGWIAPLIRYNRPPAGTCPPLSMKTYSAKPGEITREWYLVDAEGKTLGRLATQIADTLRGKRKPQFTPHVDTGDFVIVVNAEKIQVTGNKLDQKRYYRHSGYPGGLRSRTLREQLERRPTEVLRVAVKGMLPKNRLARQQITKLKIYAGPEHPHEAQNPKPLESDQ
jgi:large subunit ribosomal protein L13